MRNKKGITLIALIITIVVMLILATVVVRLTIGDNGVITQAQNAKVAQERATIEDILAMSIVYKLSASVLNNNAYIDFPRTSVAAYSNLKNAGYTINSSDTETIFDSDNTNLGTGFKILETAGNKTINIVLTGKTNTVFEGAISNTGVTIEPKGVSSVENNNDENNDNEHNHIDENYDGYCDVCGLELIDDSYYGYYEYSGQASIGIGDFKFKFFDYGYDMGAVIVGLTPQGLSKKSITIPSTVTFRNVTYTVAVLEEYVWVNNDVLETVVISEGMRKMSGHAFKNCSKLTSIEIPESMKEIQANVFDDCDSLTSIKMKCSEADCPDYSYRPWGAYNATVTFDNK